MSFLPVKLLFCQLSYQKIFLLDNFSPVKLLTSKASYQLSQPSFLPDSRAEYQLNFLPVERILTKNFPGSFKRAIYPSPSKRGNVQ